MMRTVTFNKVHKNGWHSYRVLGQTGAIFVDGRLLSAEAQANPAQTINVDIPGLLEEGADAAAKAAEKAARVAEREGKKAEKAAAAAAKTKAKLEKLQAAAVKAQAIVDAAKAKVEAANQ